MDASVWLGLGAAAVVIFAWKLPVLMKPSITCFIPINELPRGRRIVNSLPAAQERLATLISLNLRHTNAPWPRIEVYLTETPESGERLISLMRNGRLFRLVEHEGNRFWLATHIVSRRLAEAAVINTLRSIRSDSRLWP